MAELNGSDERLVSWKEISAFLGVDERTCQRWEKRYGLPVRRLEEAAKSRVSSTRSELARWRESAFRNGVPPDEKTALEVGAQADTSPKALPRQRRRIGLFLILFVLGAAAVFFTVAAATRDRQPVDFGIDPPFFVAKSKSGRELWRWDTKVPDLSPKSAVRKTFQVAQPSLSQSGIEARTQASLIIRDFDGDGWNETLYSPLSREDNDICRLFLLDRRGDRIGTFELGQPVRAGGTDYPPESVIGGLLVTDVNGDGAMEIIAVSHTRMDSPTRIVVLDLKMNLLGEYWHFGQVSDIKVEDLDGDSRPEIICCGQYNGSQEGPCLFILDPNRLRGAAPHPGLETMFQGREPGSELLYVTLPLSPLEAKRAPGVAAIRLHVLKSGRIWVYVDGDGAAYEFDFRGRLLGITLGDELERLYKTAVETGVLPHMPDFAKLRAELAAGIRYHDGKAGRWTNAWALSNPR